ADGIRIDQSGEKRGLSPIRPRQTAQASIQRQANFGLATSQNVSGYATKAKAYTSDKANQSKSVEDLASYLVSVSNDEFQTMGIPPIPKPKFKPIPSAANFVGWEMNVNSTGLRGKFGPLTIGQLTKPQMIELVGTIYHEARHGEQRYRIAQFLA